MRVSFHRLLPREIVEDEGIPLRKASVCKTRQMKLKRAAVVSTSNC
jgi:hypothetical protein